MAEETYRAPDCEFSIVFPETPSVAQACNPTREDECHYVATFTKVYALDSAINIKTTCNKAEDGMLERYSGDVMRFTLETMAKSQADEYETGFNDHGIAKQAILLGSQKTEGGQEKIYMAQLWIGKKSVFTVEGSVTGSNGEADMLFSTILKSIRHETWDKTKQIPENKEEKSEKEESPQKAN